MSEWRVFRPELTRVGWRSTDGCVQLRHIEGDKEFDQLPLRGDIRRQLQVGGEIEDAVVISAFQLVVNTFFQT